MDGWLTALFFPFGVGPGLAAGFIFVGCLDAWQRKK